MSSINMMMALRNCIRIANDYLLDVAVVWMFNTALSVVKVRNACTS